MIITCENYILVLISLFLFCRLEFIFNENTGWIKSWPSGGSQNTGKFYYFDPSNISIMDNQMEMREIRE